MIKLNEKIEVTKNQFDTIITRFAGYIMHRKEDNRFYIKIVCPGKTVEINKFLGNV